MFTVCKFKKNNHAGDINIPINKITQITLILLTSFFKVIIRRQLKFNHSNKGQEFPEITKVFLPPVACGSTRCPTGSVKRPYPNCQLF